MSATKAENKLAINGGEKAKPAPNPAVFPGGNLIDFQESSGVLEVLKTGNLFRHDPERVYKADYSSKVSEAEDRFAERIGVKYAIFVNSGTSALEDSLFALGIEPGDEIIIPAYTFRATCCAVVNLNGVHTENPVTPVLAEVDKSLTIDPHDLESKITERTKAVIPVHMRGMPAKMDEIMRIAEEHNLLILEDAAQAMGGGYKGRALGSIGHIGAYSTNQYKLMTTGEGGIIVTNDETLWQKAYAHHDSAAVWRPGMGQVMQPENVSLTAGNHRATEIHGALFLAQLNKLDDMVTTLRTNYGYLAKEIGNIPGIELREVTDKEGHIPVCLMFYVPEGTDAKRFYEALEAEGSPADGTKGTAGIKDQHVYNFWPGYKHGMCPKTDALLARTMHVDLMPQLTSMDCEMIVEGIQKVATAYL